jgi:hypothetical protein
MLSDTFTSLMDGCSYSDPTSWAISCTAIIIPTESLQPNRESTYAHEDTPHVFKAQRDVH